MIISPKPKTRDEILKKLRGQVDQGIPIIGGGAGIGLSAKCEEQGGIDLIITYNSGRFRMDGRPSISGLLPFGSANDIVRELAAQIMPMAPNTPVLAGVFAQDNYRFMDKYLEELKAFGFSGIQNFPSFADFSGSQKVELEEVGYGVENEIEMMRLAHNMDMLTAPYIFNEEQCQAMTEAGADIIVVHCGCTKGGMSGIKTDIAYGLREAAEYAERMAKVAKKANPDVFVICHGGPIAEPEDVKYILEHTENICGFFGASSMERLPAERAITQQVKNFKALHI
ncbi:phosphoenolpyruvate hydrolase family protein [Luxibacter massiliensis]|uniref:phosphoenolpyruvate hydrolase family protein n=1 Tax=Luxibacter massiliensis TaxID=2219695 RepID=UPI000F062B7E|nr:phosphoenolpyruvate hydrolase family protein [Luxibacter massiliensis]